MKKRTFLYVFVGLFILALLLVPAVIFLKADFADNDSGCQLEYLGRLNEDSGVAVWSRYDSGSQRVEKVVTDGTGAVYFWEGGGYGNPVFELELTQDEKNIACGAVTLRPR